jgi:hypothetical protein
VHCHRQPKAIVFVKVSQHVIYTIMIIPPTTNLTRVLYNLVLKLTSRMNTAIWQRPKFALSIMTAAVARQQSGFLESFEDHASKDWCGAITMPWYSMRLMARPTVNFTSPSWLPQNLLVPIGVPLPMPGILTLMDPALKLCQQCIQEWRQQDEVPMQ